MIITLTIIVALLVFRDWYRDRTVDSERADWSRERAELLQRIQAPEIAVVDHSRGEDYEAPNPVPAMSDADLWTVIGD